MRRKRKHFVASYRENVGPLVSVFTLLFLLVPAHLSPLPHTLFPSSRKASNVVQEEYLRLVLDWGVWYYMSLSRPCFDRSHCRVKERNAFSSKTYMKLLLVFNNQTCIIIHYALIIDLLCFSIMNELLQMITLRNPD
jgi:hypothetical protein